MTSLLRSLLVILLSVFSVVLAEVPVLGTVLDEENDDAISFATLSYLSGKNIGQTDARGFFEVLVGSENAVIVVKKPGYEDVTIRLDEYPDLLDVLITMQRKGLQLETKQVKGQRKVSRLGGEMEGIEALERILGMRFDINDHLSQMQGISGQGEFTSDISYEGSRSVDVTHYLGGFRVPALRHLDIGFPGNLSIINPHVLKGIQVRDKPADGPLDQGLSTALEYRLYEGNPYAFDYRVGLGTTHREFYVSGPWLWWDSFVFSYRYLDSEPLESLGEKFFTQYNKRGSEGDCTEDCDQGALKENFDLSSGDLYFNMADNNEDGSLTTLTNVFSWDEYSALQDQSDDFKSVKPLELFKGEQNIFLSSLNHTTVSGSKYHLGYYRQEEKDAFRDTLNFRYAYIEDDNEFIMSRDSNKLEDSERLTSIISGGVVG